MKTLTVRKKMVLFVIALLNSIVTFAQEGAAKVDVNVTKTSSETWYTNPILWVVGIGVFILLLVALLRGGSSRRSDA